MKTNLVKKMSVQKRFTYWILERETIKLKKKKGEEPPFTNDEILKNYRFCNVRRMDDRVSKWIYTNWYRPNFEHKNIVLACVLARHFNLPETLQLIGFPKVFSPRKIIKKLEKRAFEENKTVFNSAYVITGKNSGEPNKIRTVINTVCQYFVDNPLEDRTDFETMEETVEVLQDYPNIGTFMAGQIVADLRWATDYKFKDRKFWAPIGPGSRRGINRYFERPLRQSVKNFQEDLTKVIRNSKLELNRQFIRRLEAIDWQNCLCEFDKYERALWNEGRPKRKYGAK